MIAKERFEKIVRVQDLVSRPVHFEVLDAVVVDDRIACGEKPWTR